MREYPEYKPSNLPWLGDIPSHWEVWKVTHGFNRIGSGTTPKSDNPLFYDGAIPWITTSELREDTIRDTAQKVTQEAVALHSALKVYPEGSLAIAMYGATIGRLGILGLDSTVNQACCVFSEPTVFDTRFVYYWLWMRRPVLISLSTGGGQPNLSQDDLKKLWIPIPSIGEQRAIVRFLDHKTAQIDALIAKKQALLEKLAEQRTALISQAVTKGLDPSVPMKDSGVDWLGEIPEHWQAKRLKFLGKTKYGLGEPPQKLDGGLPFIRATDIYRGAIDGARVQTVDPDCVPWSRNPTLKAKDILVVRSGAYTGDSAIVPAEWEGSIAGYDMVYTTEGALPEYVAFNLLSKHVLNGQIYLAKNRAAQPHLNAEELGDVVIALPTHDEQVGIVAHIEECTKKLAIQFELVNGVIERLHEYRSSLITNAVTGKIDVRDFCIPTTSEQREVAHG